MSAAPLLLTAMVQDPSLHRLPERQDDMGAVAYFYLDRRSGALPPIAPGAERMRALRVPTPKK